MSGKNDTPVAELLFMVIGALICIAILKALGVGGALLGGLGGLLGAGAGGLIYRLFALRAKCG